MKELYGFKLADAALLCDMLKDRKGESLTAVFTRFSEKTGKSAGTARNLYYAVQRRAKSDEEFRARFFSGGAPEVMRTEPFKKEEEDMLIEKVAEGKKAGKSVRSVIMELAGGNGKTALRYQNKFRGIMKKDPERVLAACEKAGVKDITARGQDVSGMVSEVQFARVKREINGLISRIAAKKQRENKFLRARVAALEAEVSALRAEMLYKSRNTAAGYFRVQRARRGGSQGE